MKSGPATFEMPFCHTMPREYVLGANNRQQLMRLLAAPHEVIHQDGLVLLAVTTCSIPPEIFMCRKDGPALTYHVSFEIEHSELLGNCATNIALWRRKAPGLERSTERIFYGYFFNEFETVISALCRTEPAERFWIDRMAEAAQKGWCVGAMNGDTLVPYDGSGHGHLLDYVQEIGGRNDTKRSEGKRFFISKKATAG